MLLEGRERSQVSLSLTQCEILMMLIVKIQYSWNGSCRSQYDSDSLRAGTSAVDLECSCNIQLAENLKFFKNNFQRGSNSYVGK